ncbi:misacylated tRNA(Ala) deacylase [Microvirga flocculans]|uniref:Alanine--tRNA ligase n=1 Tax=Microvirga flocculans TaxID=217168 RepID=A0A7W6NA50_9HYPH|nr:alanyl-tRNA editing protein [Microvirga flocculans]MBB4042138.1 misacylated tRNA(Ala) deacylase [Microvirga flocculans]
MTATELLFRDDAYATTCQAKVLGTTPEGGVILDRTVFYAQGGGQPGDVGALVTSKGERIGITNTVYGADRTQVVHLVGNEAASGLAEGETVTLELEWAKRLKRMRVHTALHLLSVVLPYPVTGGSIGDGDGRLDFDIPDAGLDKADIADKLNALIARDAPVTERWITDEELDANPGLVKTMSVKPPRGSGRVRLVEIAGIDLQPCGGTHVRRIGEIGSVVITDIEKKGKQNRRVRLALAD